METHVDGRATATATTTAPTATTAMVMAETGVASTADDDDERRRGSIAVTWTRCKELLLDFHFNSDRIFHR